MTAAAVGAATMRRSSGSSGDPCHECQTFGLRVQCIIALIEVRRDNFAAARLPCGQATSTQLAIINSARRGLILTMHAKPLHRVVSTHRLRKVVIRFLSLAVALQHARF